MACGIDAVGILRAPGEQFLHSLERVRIQFVQLRRIADAYYEMPDHLALAQRLCRLCQLAAEQRRREEARRQHEEFVRRSNPVGSLQFVIQDNQVGTQFDRFRNRFFRVLCFTANNPTRSKYEQTPQRAAH
jgi:hypothetical protein